MSDLAALLVEAAAEAMREASYSSSYLEGAHAVVAAVLPLLADAVDAELPVQWSTITPLSPSDDVYRNVEYIIHGAVCAVPSVEVCSATCHGIAGHVVAWSRDRAAALIRSAVPEEPK